MTDVELILRELRGFHQENKEQLETAVEEIVKANTRMHEMEGWIEETGSRPWKKSSRLC